MKPLTRTLEVFLTSWIFIFENSAYAQDMMSDSCPMCGAMGWGGMILGGILILAIIGALIALTVFLIRRSHSPHSGLRS